MKNFTSSKVVNEYLNMVGMTQGAFNLLMNPPKENSFLKLHDIGKAVDMLDEYDKERKILIAGDYDCDGITGTSILYLGLKSLGYHPVYEIPDREEGYGMNERIVESAFLQGCGMIITVDNGVRCNWAVDYAHKLGMKVIVTDHHEYEPTFLPNADAIVHPMMEPYPFGGISGATVALKLMEALGVSEDIEDACRQLAAISIISDVMPVGSTSEEEMRFNENRWLLKDGIERMRKHPFKNLAILMKICGIDTTQVDEKDFGFTLAPVLNSTGRLESAKTGVEIFTEEDEEKVKMNAGYALYLNTERKNLTAEAMSKITNDEESAAAVELVEAPAGIVGIIAGHISKAFDKPAVVFARKTSDDGRNVLVGSARSNGVSLYDAFKNMDQSLFIAYGGHALAAGVTIYEENFDAFKDGFAKLCEQEKPEEVEQEAVFATFKELEDKATVNAIKSLKPFGNGFSSPEFLLDFDLSRVDLFFKSSHASISDRYGHQLWLYGQLNNGRSIADENSFSKVGDNTMKRMRGDAEKGVAPMSEEDALAGHWERWEGNSPVKYQVLVEANWGFFMNPEGGLQISPIVYQKA
jgi:single-stranded-DNA-specific exonuclease